MVGTMRTVKIYQRKGAWALCLVFTLVFSFAALFYPLYVIRPFRHQGARELAAALFVLQIRPYVEAVMVMAALVAIVCYWRLQARILRRIFAVACVLFVCLFAGLSRVNIFELMFHPAGRPIFSRASESKLNGAEMVLAINVGGSARAYPIRIISYHHIINDTLNGVPIVATY